MTVSSAPFPALVAQDDIGVSGESEECSSGLSAAGKSEPTTRTLEELFAQFYDGVWKRARRLGCDESFADDAAQETFVILSRKLREVEAGKEAAFLFQTLAYVLLNQRRAQRRRREDLGDVPEAPSSQSSLMGLTHAERPLAEKERQAFANSLIGEMPFELQSVFVLHELEELPMSGIADLLGIPQGTVASRLKRARSVFQEKVKLAKESALSP
ncbi:MAG: sigma-70 family RNA polymerase sigma factor [Polyangiaceae bacterium]|nr:sigma-70 family RNA polymerase sigma factor [Polyangiaceae bacterium]